MASIIRKKKEGASEPAIATTPPPTTTALEYPLPVPVTGDKAVDALLQAFIEKQEWIPSKEKIGHLETAITDRAFWASYKNFKFKEAIKAVGYRIQKRGDKNFYMIAPNEADVPAAGFTMDIDTASPAKKVAERGTGGISHEAKLEAVTKLLVAGMEVNAAVELIEKASNLIISHE